jgi:hypothetical protein
MRWKGLLTEQRRRASESHADKSQQVHKERPEGGHGCMPAVLEVIMRIIAEILKAIAVVRCKRADTE